MALILVTAFSGQAIYAQYSYPSITADTIAVGDTEFVCAYPPSICGDPDELECSCSCGQNWYFNPLEILDLGDTNIYFAPTQVGGVIDTFETYRECEELEPDHETCQEYSIWQFLLIHLFAVSDSFPHIRPLPLDRSGKFGWAIIMSQDSLNSVWTNHSTPTFDNPIADTTIFSNFSATPTNGATCALSVSDGITPITQYRALPFVRNYPLSLFFSSSNYMSFDTVIFSSRMQYANVDSVIRYRLPVTWNAPFSIVTSNSSISQSYTLPNPFSTQLQIGFTLAKAENVKLQLFDLTGREWRSEEQVFGVGNQEILLDVHDLPPGSYFYILHGAEWNRSGKVVKFAS